MKTERVSKLIERALGQLQQSLDRGVSGQMQAYLQAMSRFYRYSWGNVLLIKAQRPAATWVAGYRTWQTLGRRVRQGQRGIGIIAPIVSRRSKEEARQDQEQAEAMAVRAFKVVHLFDVSQTTGKDLPEPTRVEGDARPWLQRGKDFIESLGIVLAYSNRIGLCEGVSQRGKIIVRSGLSAANEFAVLIHELAHALLHQNNAVASRTVRETEAEAVAYVVCEVIGLDTNTASSDYVALYDGKTQTLVASLDRIQRTAARIIGGVMVGPVQRSKGRATV